MRPSFRFEGIVNYVAQLLKPLVRIFNALAVIQVTIQKAEGSVTYSKSYRN